jgi:hypothetical protein
VEPIKNKELKTLILGFKKILKKSGYFPEIQTDLEFSVLSTYFKNRNIFLRLKGSGQKTCLAELGNETLKRRVWVLLRTHQTDDWPKYIQGIKYLFMKD